MTDVFYGDRPVQSPLPVQACPSCGAPLRRAHATRAMRPGDMAVCGECASLLDVGSDLRIGLVTVERLAALPEALRVELLELSRQVARRRM
jgi:hypothetical protein